jgi:hypothetical protein
MAWHCISLEVTVKVFGKYYMCNALDGSDDDVLWSDFEILGRRIWVYYVGRLQELWPMRAMEREEGIDVVQCWFSLLFVFKVISFSGPIWAELEPG